MFDRAYLALGCAMHGCAAEWILNTSHRHRLFVCACIRYIVSSFCSVKIYSSYIVYVSSLTTIGQVLILHSAHPLVTQCCYILINVVVAGLCSAVANGRETNCLMEQRRLEKAHHCVSVWECALRTHQWTLFSLVFSNHLWIISGFVSNPRRLFWVLVSFVSRFFLFGCIHSLTYSLSIPVSLSLCGRSVHWTAMHSNDSYYDYYGVIRINCDSQNTAIGNENNRNHFSCHGHWLTAQCLHTHHTPPMLCLTKRNGCVLI